MGIREAFAYSHNGVAKVFSSDMCRMGTDPVKVDLYFNLLFQTPYQSPFVLNKPTATRNP